MTFWHNQKYESLEKSTINGDFMRGIPPKNFPWLLKSISCEDLDHDLWQIKVLCINIEGNELSQKVKAKISLEAHCSISEKNLKKMGIGFQRLFDLNLSGWNTLSEKYTLDLTCLFDKIEEKSSEFYKIFFHKIKAKYTLTNKKELITSQIQKCRVSNFS